MKYYLYIFLSLFIVKINGQEITCNIRLDSASFVKLPYYGNNQILDDVNEVTKIKSNKKSSSIDYIAGGNIINVPVKIWIYHNSNGTNAAFSDSEAYFLLKRVNVHFGENNTKFRFYNKCAIEHVYNTEFNEINSDSEFYDMFATNYDDKALNWHLINNVAYPDGSYWNGVAQFPTGSNNFSLAVKAKTDLYRVGRILAHEIGHTLYLLHTHESVRTKEIYNGDVKRKCYQESVSRVKKNLIENGCILTHGKLKCEVNGDGICDTEASPRYLNGNVNVSCEYYGNEADLWGDVFIPQARNLMAYSWHICQNSFTQGQAAAMQMAAVLYMAHGGSPLSGINGEPWYNKNVISVSGSADNGDSELIGASENIQVAFEDNTYINNAGAEVELLAQNEITFSPGFTAKYGSNLSAKVGPIINCDNITMGSTSNTKTTFLSERKENSIDSKIIDIYLKHESLKLEKEQSLQNENIDLFVFPNPANDNEITIKHHSEENFNGNVYLYSALGNLKYIKNNILVFEGENEINLTLDNLSKGIYFLQLKNDLGYIIGNTKIIKQ